MRTDKGYVREVDTLWTPYYVPEPYFTLSGPLVMLWGFKLMLPGHLMLLELLVTPS